MLAGGFPQPFSLVRKAGKGARRKVPVLPYKECDKRDDENNERQDDAHEKSPYHLFRTYHSCALRAIASDVGNIW